MSSRWPATASTTPRRSPVGCRNRDGYGTDVAMESAGITLMQGDLRGIEKAVRLPFARKHEGPGRPCDLGFRLKRFAIRSRKESLLVVARVFAAGCGRLHSFVLARSAC